MAMAVQLATEALGMGSVIRGSFDAAKTARRRCRYSA